LAGPDLTRLKIDRSAASNVGTRVRSRARRFVPAASALVFAAIIVLFGYQKYVHAPLEVQTATVTMAYPSQSYTLLNATGYVVAQRKAAVASKATGRLVWLGVQEGSRVKKDEVIARLEDQDVKASSEQAEANLRLAQANLEQGAAELKDAEVALKRSEGLLAQGFVSQSSHDSAVARHDKAIAAMSSLRASIAAAQAALRGAQVSVGQTLIRAPFDGVVLTKNANLGDVITPFSSALDTKGAVVTMADMTTLEVEADVSESNLSKVTVGQPVEIQLDALPDIRFRGTVSRTVPTVDRSKATVMTKIRFLEPDTRILPEMSAKVAFLSHEVGESERAPRPAVNPAAIVYREGRKVVFVVRGDKAEAMPLEAGDSIGDLVEILRGPQPGEKVVLRPAEKLRSGSVVRSGSK
jgi:HlyD family secretion protein